MRFVSYFPHTTRHPNCSTVLVWVVVRGFGALEGISSSAQGDVGRAALKAAFGARPIEAISPIVGGIATALTLRVQVGGRGYLLREEGEPSPLRNPHQYKSMRIAAEGGIRRECTISTKLLGWW